MIIEYKGIRKALKGTGECLQGRFGVKAAKTQTSQLVAVLEFVHADRTEVLAFDEAGLKNLAKRLKATSEEILFKHDDASESLRMYDAIDAIKDIAKELKVFQRTSGEGFALLLTGRRVLLAPYNLEMTH